MPYRYVNLRTGKVRGNVTNPAEAGTLLIEFGTLGKLTHRPVFYDKAKRALVEIYKRRSPIGLVGTWINVETGEWTDKDSHLSGAIDSYYEYLLKCAILFDDQDCRRMWTDSLAAIQQYLRDETKGRMKPELWYGHADMNSGKRTTTTYGALDAFFPAMLALSGDLNRAALLQESSYRMWMKLGIEPEEINYQTMEVVSPGYPLRPEIVESTYYLYRYANTPSKSSQVRKAGRIAPNHYLQMGQMMFHDFIKYCRTEAGYAALKSVVTKEKADSMQSFLFAETFKYFYLLFASPQILDFDRIIFNTEAHPVKRQNRLR